MPKAIDPNKKEFQDVLKAEFAPRLREAGFAGSGNNFRRVNGEVIHALNIQANKYGGSYAVNLGLQLTFLPLTWSGQPPDSAKIYAYECAFTKRLATPGKTDYWWKYSGLLVRPAKNARHLIDTYFRYGEPQFAACDTVTKILAKLSLRAIQEGAEPPLPGMATPLSTAVNAARVYLHSGDKAEARALAEYALAHHSQAPNIKPVIEEILAQC
ncbi:MAG: DUF4304 domain-containing protein [Candidatus Omnitrophica bacterium]|nr:DUF4304 domain-containing protein [Candidatus Omnitrophota bacterium]MCB9720146.1 DUF4304 domain-containing protein [Candidatus Omnitrophota bacterium]